MASVTNDAQEEFGLANEGLSRNNIEPPNSVFEEFLKCHPLVLGHFGLKIMEACGSSFENISNLNIEGADFVLGQLSRSIERIQTRLIEVVCDGVVQGESQWLLYSK